MQGTSPALFLDTVTVLILPAIARWIMALTSPILGNFKQSPTSLTFCVYLD